MYKKLLGILFTASQLTCEVHGCNFKLLEDEAQTCVSRIWSGIPLQKIEIMERLTFLNKPEMVDQKYVQPGSFERFLEEEKGKLKDNKFSTFAKACKDVYEESETPAKIAVYMLLKSVSSKYNDALKRAKILKPSKESPQLSDSLRKRMLDLASHADKSIKINQ